MSDQEDLITTEYASLGSIYDELVGFTYTYWDMMLKYRKPIDLYPPECEITGRVMVIGEL